MKKIIEYAIVSDESVAEMERHINKFIQSGWVPFQSVSVSIAGTAEGDHKCIYAQAIVRYEE